MASKQMVVAILGVGLIGGSMGLGLKASLGDQVLIKGCSLTEGEIEEALKMGAIDEGYLNPQEAVKDAEIIYLAVPVLQILPLVKKILPYLAPHAIITDGGSTKTTIAEGIWSILPQGIEYVPGHPMTGRERSGVQAAQKDLFHQKAYILVKDPRVNPVAQTKVQYLVEAVGACVYHLDLGEHDRCASLISHIPHIMAAAMVNLLGKNPQDMDSAIMLAGGGFKDTTRIASSNTVMWRDICIANKEEIQKHLGQMKELLAQVELAVAGEDAEYLAKFFAGAKACRDQILEDTKQQYELI